jgi:hypothetical protein
MSYIVRGLQVLPVSERLIMQALIGHISVVVGCEGR